MWTAKCRTYISRLSINWLYLCNKSSYIRFVYSQYHVDWLKCTEQNVNNQNLKQVSQLYVHVSFCLKVIRSWHNLPTGGHGHVICMLVYYNSTISKWSGVKHGIKQIYPTCFRWWACIQHLYYTQVTDDYLIGIWWISVSSSHPLYFPLS